LAHVQGFGMIDHPYIIFLGDGEDPVEAKTGTGVAHWRPDLCMGQHSLPGGTVDLGLPSLSLAKAAKKGAKTLVIGVANEGGFIPLHWVPTLWEAVDAGLNIASGLHVRLCDIPELEVRARERGVTLTDIRVPSASIPVGSGLRRTGKRLLTVGTDCAVGKMYATLALAQEMQARGMAADFRATGQTGILIAGGGIPIDAVVSDFVSGAAEMLTPNNAPSHWDLIEGQGSLFHPSYASVTLGLLHGSQPDVLILCHKVGLNEIDGHPSYKIPPLQRCIDIYETAARLTSPRAKVRGLSFNTQSLSKADARFYLHAATEKYNRPCFDPVRTGVAAMVDVLQTISD